MHGTQKVKKPFMVIFAIYLQGNICHSLDGKIVLLPFEIHKIIRLINFFSGRKAFSFPVAIVVLYNINAGFLINNLFVVLWVVNINILT